MSIAEDFKMTTRDDIKRWLDRGLEMTPRPSHMLVVVDKFDYGDYPVYAFSVDEARTDFTNFSDPKMMMGVMEVYSYSLPLDEQLAERRAFHFD